MNFDSLLNMFFPARCLICRAYLAPREIMCQKCADAIELRASLLCGTCFARLPDGKKICHKETPYVLGAAADYENESVRKLIAELKFNGLRLAAAPLADMLIRYAETITLPKDNRNVAVVPVPLGAERFRKRGFNQSEEVAMRFALHYKLPLFSNALIRMKNTRPQSELSFNERAANIAGAFKANEALINGYRSIILIDDVTTSGATFAEASRALKAAGVRTIYALAVAKAG